MYWEVHIVNLWTSSCPGRCLFAAYRMFSIAVIHSFWPKLVLQMAGRPHPHVMLTYPTPEQMVSVSHQSHHPVPWAGRVQKINSEQSRLPWRIEKVWKFDRQIIYCHGHFPWRTVNLPDGLFMVIFLDCLRHWLHPSQWLPGAKPTFGRRSHLQSGDVFLTGILTGRVRGKWWYYIKSGGKCRQSSITLTSW